MDGRRAPRWSSAPPSPLRRFRYLSRVELPSHRRRQQQRRRRRRRKRDLLPREKSYDQPISVLQSAALNCGQFTSSIIERQVGCRSLPASLTGVALPPSILRDRLVLGLVDAAVVLSSSISASCSSSTVHLSRHTYHLGLNLPGFVPSLTPCTSTFQPQFDLHLATGGCRSRQKPKSETIVRTVDRARRTAATAATTATTTRRQLESQGLKRAKGKTRVEPWRTVVHRLNTARACT